MLLAEVDKYMEPAQAKNDEMDVFPWHLGVFDAHCHPTDTVLSINDIPMMKARILTIMATRAQDQELVAQFADAHGVTDSCSTDLLRIADTTKDVRCQIVPSFGWHPWFSHQIYDDSVARTANNTESIDKSLHYKAVIVPSPNDAGFIESLPDPRPLSHYIAQTRLYLEKYPFALVGEIGLDRAFRIPETSPPAERDETNSALTPGGREGKRLTPYRVHMDHQRKILKAQLNLAGELSRPVSVHGVAAHGILFDTLQETWRGYEKKAVSKRARKSSASMVEALLKEVEIDAKHAALNTPVMKPFPPRICLHSYSGPPGPLKQYLHPSVPATVFFSFSELINFSSIPSKAADVIKEIPDDRLLVESDLHSAGARMDDLLEHIVRSLCQIKQWPLEKGVRQLACNWVHFVLGE